MTLSRWSALLVLAAALPACGGGTHPAPIVVVWEDTRSGIDADIYAQGFSALTGP